jgi:ribonuclease P protein subunit POP4
MLTHKSLNENKKLSQVFLGKKIQVINSSDRSKIGINGFVLNETKNCFEIETIVGKKIVPKKESIFNIELNGVNEKIDGKDICYNLSERIKKFS